MRRSCKEIEWFEDYRVGDEFVGEPVTLSEKEILEFGRIYDPQAFHVDPAAAKKSPYGGLIASGEEVMTLSFKAMIRARPGPASGANWR